jgi:hypothetical protein
MSDLFYEEDLAFHRALVAAQETKMYVYVESRSGHDRMYTVGFYAPPTHPKDAGCHKFHPMEDFEKEGEAQMMVHYMNGGGRE